jgi:hypothetical protein
MKSRGGIVFREICAPNLFNLIHQNADVVYVTLL